MTVLREDAWPEVRDDHVAVFEQIADAVGVGVGERRVGEAVRCGHELEEVGAGALELAHEAVGAGKFAHVVGCHVILARDALVHHGYAGGAAAGQPECCRAVHGVAPAAVPLVQVRDLRFELRAFQRRVVHGELGAHVGLVHGVSVGVVAHEFERGVLVGGKLEGLPVHVPALFLVGLGMRGYPVGVLVRLGLGEQLASLLVAE